MSKEIAQTVGSKRIAWLLAILAAFAVMATLSTQWRAASALAEADAAVTVAQVPAGPANIAAGATVTNTITVLIANNNLLDGIIEINPDDDLNVTGATYALAPSGNTGNCTAIAAGDPNDYQCAVGALNVGATAVITFVGTASGDISPFADGDGNNTAADGEILIRSGAADATPADDIDTETGLGLLTVVAATNIAKTNNPTTIAQAGGSYTSTVVYTSPSNAATTALTITDTITTAGLTIPLGNPTIASTGTVALGACSSTGPAGWPAAAIVTTASTVLSCPITVTSLTAGQTVTLTFTTTVPANPGLGARTITDTAGYSAIAGTINLSDTTAATVAQSGAIIAELRHMADAQTASANSGYVIGKRDVDNNVRNSRHTICAVQLNTGIDLNGDGDFGDTGDVPAVAATLPGLTLANIAVTNGGGYASTIDTDPTFSDVRIFVGNGSGTGTNAGLLGATCISWVSLDAGDQSISIIYVDPVSGLNVSAHWDTDGDANDNDGDLTDGTPNTTIVKEWNRLEDSEVVLSGGASGTAAGNSTTVPVISRNISLTMNQATGQWRASVVSITDYFRGSHTNSAGQLEGPMALVGVNWSIARAVGSSNCGTLSFPLPVGSSGVTLLSDAGTVANNAAAVFDPTGCAPGQVVRIVITGAEPGPLGSGTGTVVTEIIEFEFSAQVAAKQVFLAWAGQRIILEHDWRLPGGDALVTANGPLHVGDATAVALGGSADTVDYCPFSGPFTVTYVKGSGPGNFLPGLGASVANLADTASVVVADDDSQSFITDPDIPGDANGSCISRVLYESEDQGQVDIEAFVTDTVPGTGGNELEGDGLAYTKHAFVIYYMKINTVNVSLATQFSKPSHNSSYYSDWANTADVTKAPTNPWDASKDDSDNAADWNVSKDLLVRGRVTGWFTTTNPSGRARDDSNPLNVLPADRWVMPNDWALLAGGPADNADGSAAKGTAEQFRPYFDIMTSPNNPIYALSDPTGSGYAYAAYVTYTDYTDVSAGNTGNGSAANPIMVDSCTYLTAGRGIVFGDAATTMRTVASCDSGELVLSGARDTAPIGGTDVRLNRTGIGSAAYPIPVSSCTYLAPGTVVRTAATALGVVSTCSGTSLVVSAPASSASLLKSGTILLAPSGVPFEGPYSLVDIPGLAPLYGGAALSNLVPGGIRDTIIQDGDVNMWDAPMPPAMVSVAIRGTGFIKAVYKEDIYYSGTPNTAAIEDGGTQMYPNPFYIVNIPDSMWIPAISVGGGYLWDSWSFDGPGGLGDGVYWFWEPARVGVNSAGFADSTLTATDNAELAIIRGEYEDGTIARDLVIYSDNHGEFMVAANGDFKTDLTACQTNVLAGGKHCKTGDKVGTGTITATVDYPDFRGKHFPVLSNTATVTWLWGGYKDVTVEDGETDQYKYIVFHAMDRDGFCSTLSTGAILLHSVLTYEDDYDDFSSLGARYNGDPDENVDFMIDSGEGIIIGQSGGGAINDGKQFATGVQTFSVTENDPATSGVKEFPLSSLAASGQTDECQAWIKVSNSLLGVVNVLTIAHDDEGNIGFDRVIDLTNTMSYTLSFRWSLITWAGADAIPVSDALKGTGASGKNPGGNDISASVTAIYGWNAAAQQWLGYFPSGVNVPGANDLTSLKTGDAYWIAITGPSSVTWTIATNVN